jgi:hypothetical protein
VKLTEENKAVIDAKTYEQLLHHWRFAESGDPWMLDETGDYWAKRMQDLKNQPGGEEEHVRASKHIGWGR